MHVVQGSECKVLWASKLALVRRPPVAQLTLKHQELQKEFDSHLNNIDDSDGDMTQLAEQSGAGEAQPASNKHVSTKHRPRRSGCTTSTNAWSTQPHTPSREYGSNTQTYRRN